MLAQNCRYCPAETWLEENGGRVMIGLRAFEPMAKQLNHAGLHERVGQRSRARCPESGLVDHRGKCTTDDCRPVEIGVGRLEQAVEGTGFTCHANPTPSATARKPK